MNTAAKKQKNREYYLKNREKILSRARERNNKRRDHLEIVPDFRSEDAQPDGSSGTASGSGGVSGKTHHLSDVLQGRSRRNYTPGNVQTTQAGAPVFYAATYDNTSHSIDYAFNFRIEGVQMERTLKAVDDLPVELKISGAENAAERPFVRKKERLFNRIPLSFMLRLFLVLCLTLLMTAMQVEFYREHEILPAYAVPLALASEAAFLSLVSMKFSRSLEWLRIIIHLIFFGYFVSSLSFHIYAKSRSKAASEPLVTAPEMAEIRDQLKQAEKSLDAATRGRAWKNMEIFGAEVSRLRKLISKLPSNQVLGASSDQTLWIEAILLILLRALLLAASALNALNLRNQFIEMAYRNRPTHPCMAVA